MESLLQKARTLAQETAKISQDFAKEAAKFSQELVVETTKKSKELAVEASKKADELFLANSSRGAPSTESPPSAEKLESFGITAELLEFVKTFEIRTFREYPSKELGGEGEGSQQELTEWQEKHAVLLLQVAPDMCDFRYVLCPRRMTEGRFWRIYFKLVENYVAPYLAQANISSSAAAPASGDKAAAESSSAERDLDAFLLELDDGQGDDGSDTDLDRLMNSVTVDSDDEERDSHNVVSETSSEGVLVDLPAEAKLQK